MIEGMQVVFSKQVQNGTDELNDPTYTTQNITVDDVLIAPITEPANARESQAVCSQANQITPDFPAHATPAYTCHRVIRQKNRARPFQDDQHAEYQERKRHSIGE